MGSFYSTHWLQRCTLSTPGLCWEIPLEQLFRKITTSRLKASAPTITPFSDVNSFRQYPSNLPVLGGRGLPLSALQIEGEYEGPELRMWQSQPITCLYFLAQPMGRVPAVSCPPLSPSSLPSPRLPALAASASTRYLPLCLLHLLNTMLGSPHQSDCCALHLYHKLYCLKGRVSSVLWRHCGAPSQRPPPRAESASLASRVPSLSLQVRINERLPLISNPRSPNG